ncbi:MAG TPA: hypothetical protein VKB16_07020, partial [Beijerinckiaceae bacterium]|nr:hypothetical protein [Beijerinckiaceae bacterium]
IHKVSLAALCKARLTAFSLPNLIDRVIVGPTQHPVPIFTALVDQLRAAEVPEPERKVFVSEIPLRH